MNKSLLWLLELLSKPDIGKQKIKKLIDKFKNIDNILKTSPEEISNIAGLSIEKSIDILKIKNKSDKVWTDELKKIEKNNFNVYVYGAADYPYLLSKIYDPPILLFSYGKIIPEDYNAVSIVGTRKATGYGKSITKAISRKLALNNITVISGCAIGIDSVAHQAALDAGGRTIAVLGSGLLQMYPKENLRLMDRISENGAVMSEYRIDTKPYGYNFPARNRIISGMTLGTLIIEAPKRSGALITAANALEQNREVFAVPGSVYSAASYGTNDLIKQGAIPVSDAKDVMEEIIPLLKKEYLVMREKETFESKVSVIGKRILKEINGVPTHIDLLRDKTDLDIRILAKELTLLELNGRISQIDGKKYIKNE